MRVPHFPYSIFMLCSYKGYADKAENRNKRKTDIFRCRFSSVVLKNLRKKLHSFELVLLENDLFYRESIKMIFLLIVFCIGDSANLLG